MKKWWFLLAGIIVFSVWWQRGRQSSGGDEVKFVDSLSKGFNRAAVTASGFEGGGIWFNLESYEGREALELEQLLAEEKTKAVLVDFWTYSCINCQRTIPYLQSWWEKYKDKGLVIVGVHSPEFDFEKDKDNVGAAIDKYGVGWPVVQDNEMKIWKAYKNNYWPRKYLINKEGKIVYDHIGEGAYEETERKIQEVLGLSNMEVTKEPAEGGVAFGMKQTPELYVTERGQLSGQIGEGRDRVELVGSWKVGKDFSLAGEGAELRLDYRGGEMNLVMSVPDKIRRVVKVTIDGKRGEDLVIEANDLYKLWTGEFGRHKLEMEFEVGVRVHAFTFGK